MGQSLLVILEEDSHIDGQTSHLTLILFDVLIVLGKSSSLFDFWGHSYWTIYWLVGGYSLVSLVDK